MKRYSVSSKSLGFKIEVLKVNQVKVLIRHKFTFKRLEKNSKSTKPLLNESKGLMLQNALSL